MGKKKPFNDYRIYGDKVYIALTQGKIGIIDLDNLEKVKQYRWCAHKNGNNYYVLTNIRVNRKQKKLYLHRIIKNVINSKTEVDHRDNNGLNNCKSNLRVCNHSENAMNRKKSKNCSSKYKGVYWSKRAKKWQVHIRVNSKYIHLGYFKDEDEAAKAYNRAAIKHHKQFAHPNIIQGNINEQ